MRQPGPFAAGLMYNGDLVVPGSGTFGTYSPGFSVIEVSVNPGGNVEIWVDEKLRFTFSQKVTEPMMFAMSYLWFAGDEVTNAQWLVSRSCDTGSCGCEAAADKSNEPLVV